MEPPDKQDSQNVSDSVDVEKARHRTNVTHFCRQHRHKISSQGTKAERAVFKSGLFNLERPKKFKYHVFPDIVAAFIEARWRWTLFFCIFTYIFIWVFFAVIWWVILYAHGDFEPDHLPQANSTSWTPCVEEIHGFTSIFLFSIEIHTTIGYGTRTITLQCPSAMLTMCLESILGAITQSFIVGIVFAKLTRPKNRAQTLLFSKYAIINQRNKNLCLLFRVGDTRKSRIISVSVHAFLIRCVTANNSELGEQVKLDLSIDSSDTISFVFPLTAVHKIDENSPFFCMSARDIIKSELEILVLFEGTIESTGQPVQVTSSYTAQEILWGHRFTPMVEYKKSMQGHVVDFKKFDETYRINTPLCSAERLKHLYYE